ncbi:MAG: GDP-mannose 4,6-dehydratase [Planctomycetota bacterium JB042]
MARILVTGAAGFIGSTLSEALTARGDEVVGFDNFQPFYDPRIKRRNLETLLAGERFAFVEGDLRRPDDLARAFSGGAVDAVVHLAAMAGVRPSIEDPVLYSDINLTGTMHLLEAMRAAGTTRMMFGSSSSVYGGSKDVPFREDAVADRPVSPYAATKRSGEVLCHTYHHLHGFDVACLRFFTVYGPRQRPEMAIHKFTRKIVRGEAIPFFGDGSSRRDYTFVADIVDGVVRAVGPAEGFRIYNLGGSRTTSLAELVEKIASRVGKEAVLDRQPDQPGDVPITFADVSRAEEELGYAPKTSIDEGLDRFVEWYVATREVLEAS